MVFQEELAARVREIINLERRDVEERRMFGGITFMVAGHMCCGVVNDHLMLRLGPERAAEAMTDAHVRPMDFTGRPMKGFVFVGSEGARTDSMLRRRIRSALDFVESLPAKPDR